MEVRHWHTASGRDVIAEFLNQLSLEIRRDYTDLVLVLESGAIPEFPKSKPLTDIAPGLAELRLKDSQGIYRFFYFIKKGDAIYVVHAVQKKSQKILTKDKELILQRLKRL